MDQQELIAKGKPEEEDHLRDSTHSMSDSSAAALPDDVGLDNNRCEAENESTTLKKPLSGEFTDDSTEHTRRNSNNLTSSARYYSMINGDSARIIKQSQLEPEEDEPKNNTPRTNNSREKLRVDDKTKEELLSCSPLEEEKESVQDDEPERDDIERFYSEDSSGSEEDGKSTHGTQRTVATVGTSSSRLAPDENWGEKRTSRHYSGSGSKTTHLASGSTVFEREDASIRGSFLRDDGTMLTYKKHGRNFRRLLRTRCLGKIITRFPRTIAIVWGILIPLWMLNFLSLILGVWLASKEAPGEIGRNDDELAKEARANLTSGSVTSITAAAPRFCAELFMAEEDYDQVDIASRITQLSDVTLEQSVRAQSDVFSSQEPLGRDMNWTAWYLYMHGCGLAVKDYADEVMILTSAAERASADIELSFNWIRCHDDATGKFDAYLSDKLPMEELSLDYQSETYKRYWDEDRTELQGQYYQEFIEEGLSEADAFAKAVNSSLTDATGGDGCTLNGPGAAFFWFTVMTTIGYGNQAPDSNAGRILLYSLGFLSILTFGGILATAGMVTSAVFDDIVIRYGLRVLAKPWCACLVWGSLYYGWMAIIAWAAQAWKENRVDGPFDFGDGFWFAYLSTTTIGLGDVYLEPHVIIGSDLLYFPMLLLAGFVFLAAFLGKLRDLVMSLLKSKHATFTESLLMLMQRDKDREGAGPLMAGRMFVTENIQHNSGRFRYDPNDDTSG